MDDADTIGLDYGVVRRVAEKRIESLKNTIVHQVDNLEQLHYIRGQIKGLESLLQDLKDLQLKQERLNDGELNNFGRDPKVKTALLDAYKTKEEIQETRLDADSVSKNINLLEKLPTPTGWRLWYCLMQDLKKLKVVFY
jgi:hypothetical protein